MIIQRSDCRTSYSASVTEYQKKLKSHMAVASAHFERENRCSVGPQAWWGRKDLKNAHEAVEALNNPTPEQLRMVTSRRDEILKLTMPEPKIIRRKRRWSEDRGDVNVDRFLDGDADFYRESKATKVHGNRIISLWINVSFSYRDDAAIVNWCAVTGVVLVDILESLGFSVELNAMTSIRKGYNKGIDKDALIACRIKSEADPLNMTSVTGLVSALGFRFGNLSLLRSMARGDLQKHYGWPKRTTDPREYIECDHMETYTLPSVNGRQQCIESVKLVLTQIEREHDV